MTALTQSTKRKLSLLQLAEEIGNVSSELRLAGTEVGPSGVRGVWSRHGIETRYKRLMRLEQHAQGDTIVLSETEIRPHAPTALSSA